MPVPGLWGGAGCVHTQPAGSGGAAAAFCYPQESSPSTRVHHPCYPRGYNETVSPSSFRGSPCTDGSDLGDSIVTLEGRGNASACLAALRELFNFSACGQSQDCTFDGVHQPPLRGRFIVRQIRPRTPSAGRPPGGWDVPAAPGTVTSLQGTGARGTRAALPEGTPGIAAGWFSSQTSKWVLRVIESQSGLGWQGPPNSS